MTTLCVNCGCKADVGAAVGGKLGGAALGALGGGYFKGPAGAIVGSVLGASLGHWADCNVLPRCPECRAVLQVANAALSVR